MAPATTPKVYTQTKWLCKAEPETRMEKGHDVSFSAEEFERVKVTSWEGVRNHQAKGFLKDGMKLGHSVLIYASNCKLPGVSSIAKVIKEGYPDFNAWDPKHPYYDPKSDSASPTWYMTDLEFIRHLPHFVPLKLLQNLSLLPSPPACIPYLTPSHLKAIKEMALISRGRLSVQPVEELAFETVVLLGDKGGWEELMPQGPKKKEEKVVKEKGVKAKVVKEKVVKEKAAKKEAKEAPVGERASKRVKKD